MTQHLLMTDAVPAAIELCLVFSGKDPMLAMPACALAVSCATPTGTCPGDLAAGGVNSSIELTCNDDVGQQVICMKTFEGADEDEIILAVLLDSAPGVVVFDVFDRVANTWLGRLERHLDEDGLRTVDVEYVVRDGILTSDRREHHFVDGAVARLETWRACEDEPGTACLSRTLLFEYYPSGEIESVTVERGPDRVREVRWVMEYEAGEVSRLLEQYGDGQIDDILISGCCRNIAGCEGYHAVDEGYFASTD